MNLRTSLRAAVLVTATLSASSGFASPPAELPDHTRAKGLAWSATWLKLVHYETRHGPASGYRSAISTDSFFLAPNGRTDPAAELDATLDAFAQPVGSDRNTHPQCRFRARYLWLKRQLAFDDRTFAPVQCPLYEQWTLGGGTESISLVLATGYLANPASFYGHILLKLNGAREVRYSDLLDVSVNYGAIVPKDENPVSYILKGALGGYDGGFSHIQYYFHDHNYSEYELRDLWEYRLDLAPDEVALITAHAWELLGKKFTYYFFRQNCAYRMAELVGIVEGLDILPQLRPWTIPQSVIQKLASARHRDLPLLAEVKYHPSRQSRFHARYARLDADGRRAAGRILADPGYVRSAEFEAASPTRRGLVVDAMIDYYQYSLTDEMTQDHPLQLGYRTMLAARFELPPENDDVPRARAQAPHTGRLPGLWRVGPIIEDGESPAVFANLRGAYYDVLDSGPGHVPHAALIMGDTSVVIDDGELHLRALDLLRIDSAARPFSGLPGDGGGAWGLRLGLRPQNLDCTSCLVLRGSGARGYSFALGPHALTGLLFGGALQNARNGEGVASGELSSFIDVTENRLLRARVEYQYRIPVDGHLDERHLASGEAIAPIGSRWEARLRYEKHGADAWILTLGRYW